MPNEGIYTQRDPIGLKGGNPTVYGYVWSTLSWIDPLGLNSTILNGNLGGVTGDGLQAHHLIPVEIWNSFDTFFNNIGMGGQRDSAPNGILIPSNATSLASSTLDIIHNTSHDNYSELVRERLALIVEDFNNGNITAEQAQSSVANLQNNLDYEISMGEVETVPSNSQPGCNRLT